MRRFPGFIGVLTLVTSALAGVPAPADAKAPKCLPSGTEATIQQALTGPKSKAVLCPRAAFQLSTKIRFTAPDQQIYTQGKPRGAKRATLVLSDPTASVAIDAFNATGARVTNVVVDGGGGALAPGPPPQETALPRCTVNTPSFCVGMIMFGGYATGQRLEWVEARNTRGFTAFQCFNGTAPEVRHNRLVPNSSIGDHWPYEQSTQVADGLAVNCTNSTVTDNTVIDATDAGISMFSPMGSVIAGNKVIARSRAVIYGIALIDTTPHRGDYQGVVVRDNIIEASGGLIVNAVALGPRVGCLVPPGKDTFDYPPEPNQPDFISGATVTGNVLRGTHMGYGFVLSGARGVTVTGNRDESTHIGTPWPEVLPSAPPHTCPQPDPPSGFQFDAAHVTDSILQPEFQPARVEGTGNLCNPGDINGDGRLTGEDVQRLQVMISGGTQEPCRGDLNRDGRINSADLAALQGMVGP